MPHDPIAGPDWDVRADFLERGHVVLEMRCHHFRRRIPIVWIGAGECVVKDAADRPQHRGASRLARVPDWAVLALCAIVATLAMASAVVNAPAAPYPLKSRRE